MARDKIAVVTAAGIGDGLILHIASHNLSRMGYEVTTFNNHLDGFGAWLKGYSFAKQPSLEKIEEALSRFDAIVLQHDNTPKAKRVRELNNKIFTFYGNHLISKHGILSEFDYVCDRDRTMVDNVVRALAKWFGAASKENGLAPPEGLVYRKYPNRIAIHATSGAAEKNWPEERFLLVAEKMKNEGYIPVFLNQKGGRPLLPTLEELASFLYESGAFLGNDSGPGHLASYLKLPSLIIGKDKDEMRLWMPGWSPAESPLPRWASKWRWARNRWKQFITIRRVIKVLKTKVLRFNCN